MTVKFLKPHFQSEQKTTGVRLLQFSLFPVKVLMNAVSVGDTFHNYNKLKIVCKPTNQWPSLQFSL